MWPSDCLVNDQITYIQYSTAITKKIHFDTDGLLINSNCLLLEFRINTFYDGVSSEVIIMQLIKAYEHVPS